MTIHHYESNRHWTEDVNLDKMVEGDVVVGLDAKERLGHPTFAVFEMDEKYHGDGSTERVIHRGLFWKVEEARRYAKTLNNTNAQ